MEEIIREQIRRIFQAHGFAHPKRLTVLSDDEEIFVVDQEQTSAKVWRSWTRSSAVPAPLDAIALEVASLIGKKVWVVPNSSRWSGEKREI